MNLIFRMIDRISQYFDKHSGCPRRQHGWPCKGLTCEVGCPRRDPDLLI